MPVVHLPEIKKELKSFCRQEIQILFTAWKACFQYDKAYDKSKDIAKRTQSDNALRDKTFKIASDPNYDGYQRGLASMVYKFFDKKSNGSGVDAEPNYQLANELHRQIIENSRNEKFIHRLEKIFGVLI